MYNCVIIDDEPKSIELLKIVIEKYCAAIKVIGTAKSAEEGFKIIVNGKPDIVFLDIDMPYENGFDLIKKFEVPTFEVVFVTAYEQFALQAIKANAVDYILKPFVTNDIAKAIQKATIKIQEKKLYNSKQLSTIVPAHQLSKRIAIPTLDGLTFINIEDVSRCEADDCYTIFILKDKTKMMVSKNLSEYEEMLVNYGFHRIHQSHLINLNYVQKYVKGRGGYVIMHDGTPIDVSARKKVDFLERIFK